MLEAALAQAAFKLGVALAALVLVWCFLRFLDDHIEDDSFAQTFKTASSSDKMRYFSYRFLGACFLVGMVFS